MVLDAPAYTKSVVSQALNLYDALGLEADDDLLGATEAGRWVDYVLVNPETGDDRQKHTWAVRHDGLIFASGWYE